MSAAESEKHIHFIGIGGCSMSGLAELMREKGHIISGSDRTASHKTEALREKGVAVHIGHAPENVEGADVVVYTAAIPQDNPELVRAREQGSLCLERADFLGRLMTAYDEAILISGTHGKTTTTAMIAQMFAEAGMNPTVHIGGELPALGGGTVLGGGEYFIAEACEFNAGFLKLHPTIALVLNIDEDHLDFYRDIEDIEDHFERFVVKTPADGFAIGWGGDKRVREVLETAPCKTRLYGLEPFNELRAEDVSYDEQGRARFVATLFGHPLLEAQLSVAGEHNLLNALAAIAVAERCQLPMSRVAETLSSFTGAHRRFELTSVTDGVSIYTDYGHNPTEM